VIGGHEQGLGLVEVILINGEGEKIVNQPIN
jgi:hypothetical protein